LKKIPATARRFDGSRAPSPVRGEFAEPLGGRVLRERRDAYPRLARTASGTARQADDLWRTSPEEPSEITMNITQAPRGINVVVETDHAVYIGRLGKLDGEQVNLHHTAVYRLSDVGNPEPQIREVAKFGVPVEHIDLAIEKHGIRRVRRLGVVPKA
jgi:hypothetical protein